MEKKTIIISFQEAKRMIDFCLDSDKNVSKEFYDCISIIKKIK
jgi:hypothetical protein